jgi:hypothetical protein
VATRDFVRSELRNLLEDLAAEQRDGDREQDGDRPEKKGDRARGGADRQGRG